MELIAVYLGFLAASFVGAFALAEYLPPAIPYGIAGVSALVQWFFGWHYLVREKASAKIPAFIGVGGSVLMIVLGGTALLGNAWLLVIVAVTAGIYGLYKLADRREDKLHEAGITPRFKPAVGLLIATFIFPVTAGAFVLAAGGIVF